MSTQRERILEGLRFGVFGKGGSGKSTLVVLLARVLRRRGYQVVVLDADSSNEGLDRALSCESPPKTLIDYFGGMVFSGGMVTCPVDDPTPLSGSELSLEDLPEEYFRCCQEGIYLLTAGKMGSSGAGAGCDGPISKIARDFRFRGSLERAVMLVDFKAGLEDSARGILTSVDWALAVVDPTTAGVQTAAHLTRMVEQIHTGVPPATHHLDSSELVEIARRQFERARILGVKAILNRTQSIEVEGYLRGGLGIRGVEIAGTIRHDPAIEGAWLRGSEVSASWPMYDADRVVEAIEDAVEAHRALTFKV